MNVHNPMFSTTAEDASLLWYDPVNDSVFVTVLKDHCAFKTLTANTQ
jgi:hypothetical protein